MNNSKIIKKLFIVSVSSIHNICKDQMYQYNWAISGDMFRPLTGLRMAG